jgi:D-sedoheptulose 7-phosphate isomerase
MENFFLDYFQDLKNALDKIDLKMFKKINELLFDALENEKQIFTMGNGGSSSTAAHLVCDLNKGVSYNQRKKFKAICLNDNMPILLAYANDVSYSDIFCEQLKNFMRDGDVVIGFSGSGNSENVLKAIEYANKNGGVTIGFSGFDGGKLSKITKYSLTARINDMQKCEDIHSILCHLIMQTINNLLKTKSDG